MWKNAESRCHFLFFVYSKIFIKESICVFVTWRNKDALWSENAPIRFDRNRTGCAQNHPSPILGIKATPFFKCGGAWWNVDPLSCLFLIKDDPWCKFDLAEHLFFNQEPFLMQFQPSSTLTFQSRTVLDWISTLKHHHFSIKNHPWLNFEPRTPSFFNQEPPLIEFRPSCTLIFQSRTVLDAIPTLEHPHFSIKNRPWCNSDPLKRPFFNQGLPLIEFWTSHTLTFQSRLSNQGSTSHT